jgi:hypothetical protein
LDIIIEARDFSQHRFNRIAILQFTARKQYQATQRKQAFAEQAA